MEYGFLTLLPPIVAIGLAIRTRQVVLSLLIGLLVGWTIIGSGDLFKAFLYTIEGLVDVFKSSGNTRTILFTLLIGALIQLIQVSGGVNGFIRVIQQGISNSTKPASKLQLGAVLTGFLIFVESNISILTVGTIFQPLFRKFNISKVKLAHFADSSSAPSCILFPINAWGAYIIGLLAAYENISPFKVLVSAIPYNFYAILTLVLVVFLALSNKSYGTMKSFDNVDDNSQNIAAEPKLVGNVWDMVLPLAVMVFSMPLYLIYTGLTNDETMAGDSLWNIIGNASGSSAVLYAISTAWLFTAIRMLLKKQIDGKRLIKESYTGMNTMLEMAVLMVLAFALGNLCSELGTGQYVADTTANWLSPKLAPALLFVISCFIAFSTGTSWGTFAIMISIAIPLALQLDLNLPLALAAVLGGGVFGDHCSPISDTTLISSMAAGVDHIDHVKTQLPYAIFVGTISTILYVLAGYLA